MKNCWTKLRTHAWSQEYLGPMGWHKMKRCTDAHCNATRRVAHVGCPPTCWAGPG